VNPARIVVDTNILFSLLLRGETALRKRFLTDNAPTFHCPRFVFVEHPVPPLSFILHKSGLASERSSLRTGPRVRATHSAAGDRSTGNSSVSRGAATTVPPSRFHFGNEAGFH
jgi:hypothetical protein